MPRRGYNLCGMNTAGIYLKYNNRFAFMFGPDEKSSHHGVVRFGGHVNGNESAIACALREIREEANVDVTVSTSPRTFYLSDGYAIPVVADSYAHVRPRPILISGGTPVSPMSVMFVGRTEKSLLPSGETQGIVLLTVDEIRWLCDSHVTLQELLRSDGRIIERERLDRSLRLVPYLQLRFLRWAIDQNEIQV